MMIECDATADEIDEFRNALALVTALYRHDRHAYAIARQLIRNPADFVSSLQAICNLLLQVIDETEVATGESVLQGFRESAAVAIPKKQ
jgi:hypothetical protein